MWVGELPIFQKTGNRGRQKKRQKKKRVRKLREDPGRLNFFI